MNARKIFFGATLAAALVSFGFAEDNSADLFADSSSSDSAAQSDSSSAASAFDLTLSGDHTFAFRAPAYFENDNGNYKGTKHPTFGTEFGADAKDGTVKLVSHWKFDIDPLAASASNPNANWAGSYSIKPMENYVSWNPDKLKLSAGYQIFSWGVADKKNPTDNLNPRDYTASVNADKIPVLAADLTVYPVDGVSIEAVGIPSKSASEYPQDFAALVAGTHAATAKAGGLTPASAKVEYADKRFDPKNFVAGAKVNFNSAVCDLSLDYLYDLDQYYTPVFAVTDKGTVTVPSKLSPTGYATIPAYGLESVSLDRKRIHRIGGDAKTTLGKFGLWLEAAYNVTENSGSEDYSIRKSKLEYTLGSDVNFGPNDVGYVNLQYIGAWIPDFSTETGSLNDLVPLKGGTQSSAEKFYQRASVNALGLDTEGLMQGITCNVKYELADALVTPQLTAAYLMPFKYDDAKETRYGSLVVNPEIDLKPVDSFHVKVGADLYYAWHKVSGNDSITLDTATNPVGQYTPSNSAYLKVEYKWNADIKK
jgi:hypothetical protein